MVQSMLMTCVGQLVVERPARAEVFARHGIDYCCGGREILAKACARCGIDGMQLCAELQESDAVQLTSGAWQDGPLNRVIQHIYDKHHVPTRRELVRLSALIDQVVAEDGQKFPAIRKLQPLFAEFQAELEDHMTKEELLLFPLCRALDLAMQRPDVPCGPIDDPFRLMTQEHADSGDEMERLRGMTSNYTAPGGSSPQYGELMDSLRRLDEDLHRHMFEENNLLLPMAMAARARLIRERASAG